MKERNLTIDILRVIGILFVIAAHVDIPASVNEIISFNVVLLIFVAGMSFMVSSYNRNHDYGKYVLSRFEKLVLPTWLLVTVLFVLLRFVYHEDLSLKFILYSFLLLSDGLLFVWVYRIYFSISLFLPFFKKTIEEKNRGLLLCSFIVCLVLNDLLFQFGFSKMGAIGRLLEYIITYTVGYLIASLIGMINMKLENKQRLVWGLVFLGITFIGKMITNGANIVSYKYPPHLYYLSYGLGISFLLTVLVDNIHLKGKIKEGVIWLSIHTRSIYLWHAFFYYVLTHMNIHVTPIVFWLLLVGISTLCTYLEYKLFGIWREKHG